MTKQELNKSALFKYIRKFCNTKEKFFKHELISFLLENFKKGEKGIHYSYSKKQLIPLVDLYLNELIIDWGIKKEPQPHGIDVIEVSTNFSESWEQTNRRLFSNSASSYPFCSVCCGTTDTNQKVLTFFDREEILAVCRSCFSVCERLIILPKDLRKKYISSRFGYTPDYQIRVEQVLKFQLND